MRKGAKYSLSQELIRKIWSKYLQDERRYDKWGALGKILVVREILEGEGLALQADGDRSFDYEKLVNEIFPRTFSCQNAAKNTPADAESISAYFRRLRISLFSSGLVGRVLHSTCIEETAEKFCIRVEKVEEIIVGSDNAPSRG